MKRLLLVLVLLFSLACLVGIAETNDSPDLETRDMICTFFESQGFTIKRALFQPLIEKHSGLYGGMERWQITFINDETILGFVADGNITFCLGGKEFDNIPLDDPSACESKFGVESMSYSDLWDMLMDANFELYKREFISTYNK